MTPIKNLISNKNNKLLIFTFYFINIKFCYLIKDKFKFFLKIFEPF